MICPKCGHDNIQSVSCAHCSIIFEKYAQHEQRQREFEQAQWEREDQRKRNWLLLGGSALVGVLALSLFLFSSDPSPDTPTEQTSAQSQSRELEYYPWEHGTTSGYWERKGTQLNWVPTPDQPMLSELASKFVRSGNLHAIGFIATDDCHVIFSGDLSKRTQSKNSDQLSNLQVEHDLLQEELDEAKQRFDEKRIEFINTCKVCDEGSMKGKLKSYIKKVDQLERELAISREKLDTTNKWVERDRKLRVYIDHGSVNARIIQVSKKYPLTLLLLDQPSCNNLTIGDPEELHPDERVFALTGANRDTLYGGKFSGHSQPPDPAGYLMHDIEIPRGDFGTPLFNKQGHVLGITTTPFIGKQRAIPIDIALRDLGLLL
jgi:hypothetical protein